MNFSSIRSRLILIGILATLSLIFIGFLSVSGLNKSANSVEHLYKRNMQHSIQTNEIINLLGDARSQLLLAFQHDPDSKFVSMHNHPTTQHLDAIEKKLSEVHKLLEYELIGSNLRPKSNQIAEELLKQVNTIHNLGFNVSINEMKKGNFSNANITLLRVINPKFIEVNDTAHRLLDSILEYAAEVYNQTEDDISTFNTELIATIVIITLVLCTVIFFISQRLFLALNKIRDVAEEVTKGNLTQQVTLEGNDELAGLAAYVDKIVTSFRHVIATMNDSATQLATTAEESSVIAEQTKKNIIQQQQETQMVATAINEFSSTVQEVANSASSAAQASEGAETATNEGKYVVTDTITMITELNQEIDNTTNIIQKLSEQSNQIGSVVDVIDDISEQTNLLALNAAIEAARAGEAGRGFAVVADEVRSLASRTQKSTVEIKEMISSLQESSKQSLHSMQNGAEKAKSTVVTAEKAGTALDEIANSVTQISSLNVQIATAAEEQSVVTDEINQNVSSINDISVQTADGAEQSSAASHELSKLTEAMKEQVSKYRF